MLQAAGQVSQRPSISFPDEHTGQRLKADRHEASRYETVAEGDGSHGVYMLCIWSTPAGADLDVAAPQEAQNQSQ